MIDKNGYRLNVGMILANGQGQLFWGKRIRANGWQFPQGGVHPDETLEETMFRELAEEIGLTKKDVKILSTTKKWFHYKLPTYLQQNQHKLFIGQKQKWFLLRLTSEENKINLRKCSKPEFNGWKWIDYWEPPKHVVYFKRDVYLKVLTEFAPIMQKCIIC